MQMLTEYSAQAGSGDNAARIAVHPGDVIVIDGVTLDLPQIALLPLDEVARSFGTAIDGIIGFPLMQRFVVTVDFDERTLALTDPALFHPPAGAAELALDNVLKSREPVVTARVIVGGGRAVDGRFLIDQPHPDSLLFATPFVREHDLLAASRILTPRPLPGTATGVGGQFDSKIGGSRRFSSVPFCWACLHPPCTRPTRAAARSRGATSPASSAARCCGAFA